MSNQFNYELDERKIRMMMQGSELDYNEALWNKFDNLTAAKHTSSSSIGSFVPQFNLSISRSIIVPIIFIVLIGGLSAMLFSFVDFKKKESITNEIPYVATVKPVVQPKVKPKVIAKAIPAQIQSATNQNAIDSAMLKVANAPISVPAAQVAKKEQPVVTEIKQTPVFAKNTDEKKDLIVQPKIKKRKVKSEPLPTIDATTNINLNEGATEPELDLK